MAEQIRMPSGMGGLVRYFDDFKTKVNLSPELIVGVIIAVIVLEYILHNFI
ncbi:preprotein translocase subunit Sec61beta [Candidatus Woesearchaeota archaeon]|nr:preprotein translocase subunit Sec61beta [Candidatus Woesearchaeota archaeon]